MPLESISIQVTDKGIRPANVLLSWYTCIVPQHDLYYLDEAETLVHLEAGKEYFFPQLVANRYYQLYASTDMVPSRFRLTVVRNSQVIHPKVGCIGQEGNTYFAYFGTNLTQSTKVIPEDSVVELSYVDQVGSPHKVNFPAMYDIHLEGGSPVDRVIMKSIEKEDYPNTSNWSVTWKVNGSSATMAFDDPTMLCSQRDDTPSVLSIAFLGDIPSHDPNAEIVQEFFSEALGEVPEDRLEVTFVASEPGEEEEEGPRLMCFWCSASSLRQARSSLR